MQWRAAPAPETSTTNARLVPTASWIGTPMTVSNGTTMKPPLTSRVPESTPVVRPAIANP